MLQALISLSDPQIELVTESVSEWCRSHHCDIDSGDGRRALTVAIDLVQSQQSGDILLSKLAQRLAPIGSGPAEIVL